MNRCFLRIDGLKPQQAASCWWGLCCLLIAQPVEVLTEQLLLGERHMCVVLACFSAISRKRCEATLVAPFNCWDTGDAFLSVQEPKWCFARDRRYLACSVVFKTVQDVLYIIIVKEVNLRPLIRPWFFFFPVSSTVCKLFPGEGICLYELLVFLVLYIPAWSLLISVMLLCFIASRITSLTNGLFAAAKFLF